LRDLLGTPHGLHDAANPPAAVGAEDDVGIEDGDERVEVAGARGGEEGSDDLALWFIGASVLFTVFMYGVAETMASRVPRQEEYIAATPAIAILPWFFAAALLPIGALPAALTEFASSFR
jgi:hypothetical protein